MNKKQRAENKDNSDLSQSLDRFWCFHLICHEITSI